MRFLGIVVLLVVASLFTAALTPPRVARADQKGLGRKVHPHPVKYGGSAISATNSMHVSDAALYTDAISMVDSCWQSMAWTITPSATIALPVELEWSDDGTTFQSFRTAETWTVTATETLALFRISVPVCPYVRLKLGPEPSSHVCTVTEVNLYRF